MDFPPPINFVDINAFFSRDIMIFLIGMLLVKMIEDGCGHAKLLEALETVNTDDELILFMEKEVGIKENEINVILRTLINRCSLEGFETKY